mmetsp:Transcript_36923/g.80439  ORF Transcript_36923/g.80439 Transcript_36923/m.80439 type:complete len:204 (+) Transcript_36923:216-827(+)
MGSTQPSVRWCSSGGKACVQAPLSGGGPVNTITLRAIVVPSSSNTVISRSQAAASATNALRVFSIPSSSLGSPPPRLANSRPPGRSAASHAAHVASSSSWGSRWLAAKRSTKSPAKPPSTAERAPKASPQVTTRAPVGACSSSATPRCGRATSMTSLSYSHASMSRSGQYLCASTAAVPPPNPRNPREPSRGNSGSITVTTSQ